MNKVDGNQSEIVSALRDLGASVAILADLGCGIPDLLVGWRDHNLLLEVKNPDGRGNRTTPAEISWTESWKGQIGVVNNVEEALSVLQGSV
jgi:hypothetical protein